MKVAMGITCSASIRANLSRLHMKSAVLFMEQCKKIAATESTMPWPQPHLQESQSYASAAIILAVAALEASINEFYLDAVDGKSYRTESIPDVKRDLLAKKWKKLPQMYPALKKFKIVLEICDKPSFNESAEVYTSTSALIDLRNTLIHFKPEWDDALDDLEKLQKRLKDKFSECALALRAQGHMVWFPDKCLGAGCAEWAITTVEGFDAAFSNILGIPQKLSRVVI